MNNSFNIGIGLLIILVILLMIGQNNLLELPVDIFEDVVDVGEHGFDDLESDFLTKDMHGSDYDVLGLINTHNVTNFYDDNNDVANHLFDLF